MVPARGNAAPRAPTPPRIKNEGAAVLSEDLAAPYIQRLFVIDQHTGRRFLVDSGAEISLLPGLPSKFENQNNSIFSTLNLIAANGSKIKTYGPASYKDVRTGRYGTAYPWSRLPAYYGLLVDIRRSRLVDTSHRFSVQASLAPDTTPAVICAIARPSMWTSLLLDFPEVTRESPVPTEFLHGVVHEILTTGPPLFARPRRLPPDRLSIARREFDFMRQKGICRPSSSPWASPLLLVAKKEGTFHPCGDYRRL